MASAYIWNGQALFFSSSVDTTAHQHHALQITIALDNYFLLRESRGGKWQEYQAVVVPSDRLHQLDTVGQPVAFIYLDAESKGARNLSLQAREGGLLKINAREIEPVITQLRRCWREQLCCDEANSIVIRLMQSLTADSNPLQPLDPRITRALAIIDSLPERRISEQSLATAVALSSDRFRHLFREQLGLPLRRYLLWRRLQDAMVASLKGRSLTEASHEVGFADAAHMSRTFRRMFGIKASILVKNSRFVQFHLCQE